jgi:hypothetical protein
MLSMTRTARANAVVVELSGVFHDYDIMSLDLGLRVFLFFKFFFHVG